MSYFILQNSGKNEAIRRDKITAITVSEIKNGLHIILDVEERLCFSQIVLSNYQGSENLHFLSEKLLYYILNYPQEIDIDTTGIKQFIKTEIENLQGKYQRLKKTHHG